MRKSIFKSVPKVMKVLDETIDRTKEKGKIIVVGVGNTSGVGNDKKGIDESNKIIKKNIKRMQVLKRKKRKKFKFFL